MRDVCRRTLLDENFELAAHLLGQARLGFLRFQDRPMPDYLKVVLHRICLLAIWPGVAVAALPSVVERTYVETPEAVLAYWTDEKLRAVEDKGEVPLKPPSADPLNSDGDAWEGTGRFPAGVGRLFSTSPSAKDVSCTATAVDSPAGNVLVTAFHCVSQLDEDGNPVWNSYLMFVPGFVDGVAPQGRHPVGRMVAPVDVLETGDIAFLRVYPRADGRSVAEMAGTQAIRFDIPASASPRIDFGYPVSANGYGILPPPAPYEFGNPEYSGQRLAYCATQRAMLDPCENVQAGFAGWGFQCVQGPGSSGGPSLVEFNFDTGRGTVAGVNSHGVIMQGRAAGCKAPLQESSALAYDYITR